MNKSNKFSPEFRAEAAVALRTHTSSFLGRACLRSPRNGCASASKTVELKVRRATRLRSPPAVTPSGVVSWSLLFHFNQEYSNEIRSHLVGTPYRLRYRI